MRNITLSADEDLIRRARQRAESDNTSLNEAFREWLTQYAGAKVGVQSYDRLMQRLDYVDFGRKFSRSEMNER